MWHLQMRKWGTGPGAHVHASGVPWAWGRQAGRRPQAQLATEAASQGGRTPLCWHSESPACSHSQMGASPRSTSVK